MNTVGVGTTASFANLTTPFNPLGKQAVGLENAQAKEEALAPVEESAKSEGLANRESKEQPLPGNAGGIAERSGDERQDGENSAESERREQKQAQEQQVQEQQEQLDQQLIRELAARDREVRAHEQAHAAVGGQYAGAPSYSFERGPDGVNYAVGGEVSISLPSGGGDPRATLSAAEQVRRAALAPAQPSSQDRQVAAQAAKIALEALADIVALENSEEPKPVVDESEDDTESVAVAREKEPAVSRAGDNESRQQLAADNNRRLQTLGDQLVAVDRVNSESSVGTFVDRRA